MLSSRARNCTYIVVLATFVLALAAPIASAAPNRQCGVIKVRGTWMQVETFGAGGPKCKAARKVIRKTFRRKANYKGYACSKGRFPQLWGCFHKNGSKNALAYYYDR
jgi:hypothetical protein